MRQIINSVKHIVQLPVIGIASGAVGNFLIVKTVVKGAARAATSTVEEGCIIKAIYIELWVKADNPNFTVTTAVYKRPANVAAPTFTDMSNLQAYPNKKNIFEIHQGLAPSGDQTLAIFRHWIKIPKGKQRFGVDDKIEVQTAFTGSAGDLCGFATYKEYE